MQSVDNANCLWLITWSSCKGPYDNTCKCKYVSNQNPEVPLSPSCPDCLCPQPAAMDQWQTIIVYQLLCECSILVIRKMYQITGSLCYFLFAVVSTPLCCERLTKASMLDSKDWEDRTLNWGIKAKYQIKESPDKCQGVFIYPLLSLLPADNEACLLRHGRLSMSALAVELTWGTLHVGTKRDSFLAYLSDRHNQHSLCSVYTGLENTVRAGTLSPQFDRLPTQRP